MAFETNTNEWFEINKEMKGWNELIDIIPKHLDGITDQSQWWSQVAFPAFETNEIIIFKRTK